VLAKDRLLWGKFYYADWLTDVKVRALHPIARAAYFDLLAHHWGEKSLPFCAKTVQKLSGLSPSQWRYHGKKVMELFDVIDGRYVNKRMARERILAEETHLKHMEAGAKGARVKWQGYSEAINDDSSQAIAIQKQKQIQKQTTTTEKIHTSEVSKELGRDNSLGRATRKLCERYTDPDRNDPVDDIPTMKEVLRLLLTRRDQTSARAESVQLRILQALDGFDLGQVVMASYKFLERDLGEIGWPYDRYHLAMVRDDAGGYQRQKEKEEKRHEQTQRDKGAGRDKDTAPRDSGDTSSLHTVGDVLRNVRPVLGLSDSEGEPRPETPD